jgi:DNA (cytosine-5)-methyltransferase 1
MATLEPSTESGQSKPWRETENAFNSRAIDGLADGDKTGRGLERIAPLRENGHAPTGDDVDGCGTAGGVGDHDRAGSQKCEYEKLPGTEWHNERRTVGQSNGAWADLEWLPCRDGKTRPTESGLFPLAHGVSARMGRLRGYGNAIVPQVAAEVIRAYMEA